MTVNKSDYQFIIHDERKYSNLNQCMITLKSLNPLTTSPNFTSKESPILHITLSSKILRFQMSSEESSKLKKSKTCAKIFLPFDVG